MSSRTTLGEDMPSGSLAANTPLPYSTLSSRAPLELREISKPSPDELELGAGFLFAAVLILPAAFVWSVVFFYQAFVSEFVQH